MEISYRCRIHMVKKEWKKKVAITIFWHTDNKKFSNLYERSCKMQGCLKEKNQNLTKFPRSFRCRSHGFCLAEPKNQGWILILCPNQLTHSHIHTQSHRIYLFISFTSSYHHPDESGAQIIPLRRNCRVDMWCYAILSTSDMDFSSWK